MEVPATLGPENGSAVSFYGSGQVPGAAAHDTPMSEVKPFSALTQQSTTEITIESVRKRLQER